MRIKKEKYWQETYDVMVSRYKEAWESAEQRMREETDKEEAEIFAKGEQERRTKLSWNGTKGALHVNILKRIWRKIMSFFFPKEYTDYLVAKRDHEYILERGNASDINSFFDNPDLYKLLTEEQRKKYIAFAYWVDYKNDPNFRCNFIPSDIEAIGIELKKVLQMPEGSLPLRMPWWRRLIS